MEGNIIIMLRLWLLLLITIPYRQLCNRLIKPNPYCDFLYGGQHNNNAATMTTTSNNNTVSTPIIQPLIIQTWFFGWNWIIFLFSIIQTAISNNSDKLWTFRPPGSPQWRHIVRWAGQPGSGSALAQDKPLQPEYRDNNCNHCTTLAVLLVNCYVGMSLCSFEVCFDWNLKQ